MRYAIVSDIHGNFEAMDAVRGALLKERIDACIALGDIVGYGADPAAVIEAVRGLKVRVSVAGNHDWGVLGRTGIEYFNDYAREAVEWTKTVLGARDFAYLESLDLVRTEDDMTFVHGSLEDPASFNYILNRGDAYITIELMKTPITFVGHSHVAGIYCARGRKISCEDATRVDLEAGTRYLVNAGSVGQPRDGDARAAYVIYDDEAGVIEIKRVLYDIKGAQKKIIDAGLPAFLAYRLGKGT